MDAIINYMELLKEINKSGRGNNGSTTKGNNVFGKSNYKFWEVMPK
jgi:hypothetical protein